MQVLAPLGGWRSLYKHGHTYRGVCAAVQPSPGSHRALQVSTGIRVSLTANKCSMPLGAMGWASATPRY